MKTNITFCTLYIVLHIVIVFDCNKLFNAVHKSFLNRVPT